MTLRRMGLAAWLALAALACKHDEASEPGAASASASGSSSAPPAASSAAPPADIGVRCAARACTIRRVTPEVRTRVAQATEKHTMSTGDEITAGQDIRFDTGTTNEDVATISMLPDTRSLDVSKVKGELDLGPLASLHALVSLDIGHQRVKSLAPLAGLPLAELFTSEAKGIALDTLGPMPAMKFLSAPSTGLTSLSPALTMTALETLVVTDNPGLDRVDGIGALTHLKQLDVSSTGVRDLAPVSALANLERLWASNLKLTKLPDFGKLAKLKQLDLQKNDLADVGRVRGASHLETLRLQENPKLRSLAGLASLPRLHELSISGTAVDSLDEILRMPAISELRLNDKIKSIAKLATLKTLSLLSIPRGSASAADIAALKKALPTLSVQQF